MKLSALCRPLLLCLVTCCAAHAMNAAAADPDKVVRMAFEAADDGFDPGHTTNLYSAWVNEAIFDPLRTYHYLARPAKLIPDSAQAMPDIGDRGKTYTFH